jgi:hypothetical protein
MGAGFIFAGAQVSVWDVTIYPAWVQDFVLHGCRDLWQIYWYNNITIPSALGR